MKKLLYLLSIVLLPFISSASHLLGGTITWECLTNGKYVFYAELYRDCRGIGFSFNDISINIVGSPLPRDLNGQTVSSFILQPDSAKWIANNLGDLSPNCDLGAGQQFSCTNGNNGAAQAFYFKSDQIVLNGIPPPNGWKFFWEVSCCRPSDVDNVNTQGSLMLQAIMFPNSNSQSVNACNNSAPQFAIAPNVMICRDELSTLAMFVIDKDGDSLVYSFSRPFNQPRSNPLALNYYPGYSPANPTPDSNFNVNNVPSTLNSSNGKYSLKVSSGSGYQRFLIVVKAEEYRKGVKLSEVNREFPLIVLDCPNLSNGNKNNSPRVAINGNFKNELTIKATAGDQLSVDLQAFDFDLTGGINPVQILRANLFGNPLTEFGDLTSTCNESSCAYFENNTPKVDSSKGSNQLYLESLAAIQTTFKWQTTCDNIRQPIQPDGYNEDQFNFLVDIKDDHCPVVGNSQINLTVILKDPFPLEAPNLIGASVNLDGSITFQWVPATDSMLTFKTYVSEGAQLTKGQATNNNLYFNLKQTNKYQQSDSTSSLFVYEFRNPFDVNSGTNLFQKTGYNRGLSFDFFLRMKSISGCSDTSNSLWSSGIKVIDLEATDGGVIKNRDSVLLNWNTAGKTGINASSNVISSSRTKYYVYASDSLRFNGQLNDSLLRIPTNWNIVGETNDTSFITTSGICNDYAAFRVEARDTVVKFRQGTKFNQLIYDTLYFSTFSIIDTFFINSGVPAITNENNEELTCNLFRSSYQWIDCSTNSPIQGATNRTFVPQSAGFYKVVAINSNCSDTSDCFQAEPIVRSDVKTSGIDYLYTDMEGYEWQWKRCDISWGSTIVTSVNRFVPSNGGIYKVHVKRFGYEDSSLNCFTILDPNREIDVFGLDSIRLKDTVAHVQWYRGSRWNGTRRKLIGATNSSLVPDSSGEHHADLSIYDITYNSFSYYAPVLKDSVVILTNQTLKSVDSLVRFEWIECNSSVSLTNNTNRIFTVPDTGSYAVLLSAFNYSVTSECINMYAVGLLENSFLSQIRYYPNPTDGVININLANQENVLVQIRNIQGQLVQEQQFKNQSNLELNIEGKAGVYFIQMRNEKGETANLKVVKQ